MSLSNQARVMLAAQWLNPRSTLRYEMVENEPSDEVKAVLAELILAGLVWQETEASGALVFRLTQRGAEADRTPPGSTIAEKWNFMHENGNFLLSKPRELSTGVPE